MHETGFCFHNLESPPAGTGLASGRVQLRGWLVGKPGRHFVNVRARSGKKLFPGVLGFPRPDLAAHFAPDRPWLPAEYTIELDLPAGPAEVALEALEFSGSWQTFHTVTSTIQAAPPPAPAPDAVTALEFGRTAQLSYALGEAVAVPWPRVLRQDHLPFHGYLASPEAIAPALYGRLDVIGWLFHEQQPVSRAFVSTDLIAFQPLELGGEFPGVPQRFPGQPRAADCRFRGVVDVSSRLSAPACVRLYAELADGSVHLCLATLCRPVATEELKRPAPPFNAWRFWRHWRATREALAQKGVPVETGPARRREFWAALRQQRRLAAPRVGRPEPAPPTPLPPARATGLRLLLITHNLNLEGAPLLFVEYAAHLIRHTGAKITLLAAQDGPLREAWTAAGATVTIADPALVAAATPSALAARLATAARAFDWTQIDLVVANTLATYWGVLLARRVRKPSLLYIHESTTPQAFKALPSALLPAVQEAFRHATAVSFNTPATRAYYEHLGTGRNYHLNPAWIDAAAIDAFRRAHPRATLRRQLGLSEGERLVANIGTVCERKGQHDFVRAIEWLWQSDPALAARGRFVLVGGRDTKYNADLRGQIAATGRKNVHIVAETTGAFDFFGAADLFVCSSYEESFPRVVLEAMAFGVPVVSTNVHGIPYLLRDGEEALLTAPGDAAGLAAAMRRLLENPDQARTLADRAGRRIAEFDAAVLLPRHASFTAAVAAQTL